MDKSSEEYLEHIKKLEPRKWLPEDIKIAIESFIASTIMVEENDLDYVPNEYVINLLETIKKHKEYNSLCVKARNFYGSNYPGSLSEKKR